MITLTQRLAANEGTVASLTLCLTAEERARSRQTLTASNGQPVQLQLPRGTIVQDGDRLYSDAGIVVQVVAKSEPVFTVTAQTTLDLLQAAYHLGNRHVPLEITATYLRLSPDSVLRQLLEHRGLQVIEENQPFQPEIGAYGHHH